MLINRKYFFLSLFVLITIPTIFPTIIWLANSEKTAGVFIMNGKGNALDQVRTTKSYLSFRHENNTISFTQLGNLPFKEGEQVPIVYQKTNPADAHIDSFMCIWGATAFYVGVPLLMLFITAIHPDIVPYSSRIRVSIKKPFFQIVSKEN